MATFTERMIGAAKLDVAIFEEVERDAGAMGQAMGVVLLSGLATAIGSAAGGVTGMFGALIGSLIGWFLWAAITWLVGTKLLPESGTEADISQMMRVLGFAASPGILKIVGIIPILGGLARLAISIWMLVAMVIAVRQALDYQSTGRAVGVCIIGFFVYLAVTFGIAILTGGVGMMAGAFS